MTSSENLFMNISDILQGCGVGVLPKKRTPHTA